MMNIIFSQLPLSRILHNKIPVIEPMLMHLSKYQNGNASHENRTCVALGMRRQLFSFYDCVGRDSLARSCCKILTQDHVGLPVRRWQGLPHGLETHRRCHIRVLFRKGPLSFENAKDACRKLQTRMGRKVTLVSITNGIENGAVWSLVRKHGIGVWLGLHIIYMPHIFQTPFVSTGKALFFGHIQESFPCIQRFGVINLTLTVTKNHWNGA